MGGRVVHHCYVLLFFVLSSGVLRIFLKKILEPRVKNSRTLDLAVVDSMKNWSA